MAGGYKNPRDNDLIPKTMASATIYGVVTPHDTNAQPAHKALMIGATGGALVVTLGGTDVTFTVAANQIIPIYAPIIKSTGTAATTIHWLDW